MPAELPTRSNLRTPKAAAIAGIVFSVLLITVFWLLRTSIPADPQEPGSWLRSNSSFVALALNLLPFAGIAFLWFIGVLRDRLGDLEDRFFSTVFFGSALLFLAMLFTAAALVGAILIAFATQPEEAHRFGIISTRTSRRLQFSECLHGQDGERVHDRNSHRGKAHGDYAALACFYGLCISLHSFYLGAFILAGVFSCSRPGCSLLAFAF